ncbi:MAG: VanZ family protein [Anaerolineales bacterium]
MANNKHTGCLAAIIGSVGLLIILYSTLNPFDFHFHRFGIGDYFAAYNLYPSSAGDFPRNILLFMPFGFSLGAILEQRGWSNNRVRLAVLVSGFLLTMLVESLQYFLPTRQPSVADLIGNSLGALAGLALFHLLQKHKIETNWLAAKIAEPKKAISIFALYAFFLLLMTYGLSTSTRFRDWNVNYRMMLGNERTGDRVWVGSARDLAIYNRVLDPLVARDLLRNPEIALVNREGLLAYYPLTGFEKLQDVTGNQPDLFSPTGDEKESEQTVTQFNNNHWLETRSTVRELTKSIQETSQMSVRLSVAPVNLIQVGPARILSISENPYFRNMTLGQEGSDLIIRLRTPLTGENGTRPEIVFQDFFTGPDFKDFLITYNGLTVTLYDAQSDSERSVMMVPGVAFFFFFLNPLLGEAQASLWAPVTPLSARIYDLIYYTLVLVPAGIFVSLRSAKAWPRAYRFILIFFSLLVLPVLLELVLVSQSGQALRPLYVIFSMAAIMLIAWLIIPVIRRLV